MKSFIIFLLLLTSVNSSFSIAFNYSNNEDSILKQENNPIYFYDTSTIFTENWLVNITFAYADKSYTASEKIYFTDSIRGFAYPIEHPMTSPFGKRHSSYHKGIDIPLRTGEKVMAAFDGKVRYAKYNNGGFGRLVIIRHANGTETYYAHLSKIRVKANQIVKAGQEIGLGGSTGRSYSPHLHFEIRYHDRPINPENIFDTESYCLRNEDAMLGTLILKKSHHVSPIITEEYIANGSVYSIKSGDTLSKISQRTGMSIQDICSLNGIQRNDVLRIGQKIKVIQ